MKKKTNVKAGRGFARRFKIKTPMTHAVCIQGSWNRNSPTRWYG